MKGIKIQLLGIAVCLTGLSLASNNLFAFAGCFFGLVLAIAGLFTKEQ